MPYNHSKLGPKKKKPFKTEVRGLRSRERKNKGRNKNANQCNCLKKNPRALSYEITGTFLVLSYYLAFFLRI